MRNEKRRQAHFIRTKAYRYIQKVIRMTYGDKWMHATKHILDHRVFSIRSGLNDNMNADILRTDRYAHSGVPGKGEEG